MFAAACAQDIRVLSGGGVNRSRRDAGTSSTALDSGVDRDGGHADDSGRHEDAGAVHPDATVAPDAVGFPDAAPSPDAEPSCPGLGAKTSAFEQARTSDGSLSSGIAFGNGRVAMVWEDVTARRVMFAMVNPDGSPRVAPRVIGTSAYSPAITYAEGDFAVVYHDAGLRDLQFVRFDRDGVEVRRTPLAQDVDSMAGYPKVVYRMDRFAVAWFDGSDASGFTMMFARLRFDGIRVEQFARFASTTQTTALPDLTVTDSGFAIAWVDERNGDQRVYAARVGQDGVKVDPPGDMMLTDGSRPNLFPTIASDGDDLQVCYDVTIDGIGKEIECRHVSPSNRVSPPLTIVRGDDISSFPKTIWTGSRYFVAWAGQNLGVGQVFGRVLNPDGSPETNVVRLTEIPGTAGYPSAAWLGNGYGVGWYQYAAADGWKYVYQFYGCAR